MKKFMQSKVFFSICTFLVAVAPVVDIGSRSLGLWGEPNFPGENDDYK